MMKKNALPHIRNYFGLYQFDAAKMEKKLKKSDFNQISNIIQFGGQMNPDLADKVAQAARDWALENGAFHYCHWFQPQTGITAEKHESFLWFDKNGPVEKFSGADLLKSEPDASSFPSGGKRSTFEARGYTAWDPSSPMFIWGRGEEKTLYIPSIFVSYHGEALDFKTPLLRSNDALEKEAIKTLHYLGQKHVKQVFNMVGSEQEFFLIDKEFASKRSDIKFTGRTLFGKQPPKGQELEDHYFGHIPSKVHAFLGELESELYKLGVPLKTKHNEVAPRQFEVAPIFEMSNIAADHNQLLMNLMKEVANKYNFVVLLHEKPFNLMNGSGKHINWSIADGEGKNFLDPGNTPEDNFTFLTFLCAVLLGVSQHSDVLRASVASASNDHRLGAHEAPPAIISVFLGENLDSVLNAIESDKNTKKSVQKLMMNLGLSHVQNFPKDNTDRNRTSPLAFTGNKFEFRAAGSNASISYPITILNGAVAHGLAQINEMISAKIGTSKSISQTELVSILKQIIQNTKKIRFEGNGYSKDWEKEAKEKGLSNFANTPSALKALNKSKNVQFLIDAKIFSADDVHSRLTVQYERYIKECLIELNCALEMVYTQIIPCALTYYKSLLKTQALAREASAPQCCDQLVRTLGTLVSKLTDCTYILQASVNELSSKFETANEKFADIADKLVETELEQLKQLRLYVDAIEAIVPKENWPYPNYSEMLFEV